MDDVLHRVLKGLIGFCVVNLSLLSVVTSSGDELAIVDSGRTADLFIYSRVFSRFATVSITSRVNNTGVVDKEVLFHVQLPEHAFITDFVMENENRTLHGVVKEKSEAKTDYDRARDSGQSAGHIEQVSPPGRHMKTFAVRLNVASESRATFELKYQEQLSRIQKKYKHTIHIEPTFNVSSAKLVATYEETEGIESFSYALPGSKNFLPGFSTNEVELSASTTKRTIIYEPKTVLSGDFIVKYDISHRGDGGTLFQIGDTFLHYFTPNEEMAHMKQSIIFVIDISGSMSGNKIMQTGKAMENILNVLPSHDYFNIILFNGEVSHWQANAQIASSHNVRRAKNFVMERAKAGGSTNINDAIIVALSNLINKENDDHRRAKMIVFLTDGMATAGVTDDRSILDNIRKYNEGRVSIYCLGFGFDMNFDFLKKMAYQNGGTAHRIWDDTDSSDQLVTFYNSIGSVALRNVKFEYSNKMVLEDEVTATKFPYCFVGTELVIVGKTVPGTKDITATVTGTGKNNDIRYNVSSKNDVMYNTRKNYFDRVWAFKSINFYLMKALEYDTNEEKQKFYNEKALQLSLKYNFVTPLTSMVVTKAVHRDGQEQGMMEDMGLRKSSSYGVQAIRPRIHRTLNSGNQYAGSAASKASFSCLMIVLITPLLWKKSVISG